MTTTVSPAMDQGSKISVETAKDPVADFSIAPATNEPVQYKLYKRRYIGLVGLVFLNIVAGMALPWFGPIAVSASEEFGLTVNQINWFANIVCLVYVPCIFFIPWIVSNHGIQRTCQVGGISILLSGWIRYAGTAKSLPTSGSYALLVIGQFFGAIAHASFQVIAPKYSEVWFGLKGRTTATMFVSISSPVGGAIGQLISPAIPSARTSVLVLAIMLTVAAPFAILIGEKPPTPPTYAAAQEAPSFLSLFKNLAGKEVVSGSGQRQRMTIRERIDFVILTLLFGAFVGVTNGFSTFSSQYISPYGYSDSTAGHMGATLLFSGVGVAIISAPILDRFIANRLSLAIRILTPVLAACWLGLIWAVRPNNTGALFAIFAIIGSGSITLVPIALEIAVELSRAAATSSAVLWGAGNLLGFVIVLSESSMKAGPSASPPDNMRKALVFQGSFICAVVCLTVVFKGEQTRRKQDEARQNGNTEVRMVELRDEATAV